MKGARICRTCYLYKPFFLLKMISVPPRWLSAPARPALIPETPLRPSRRRCNDFNAVHYHIPAPARGWPLTAQASRYSLPQTAAYIFPYELFLPLLFSLR